MLDRIPDDFRPADRRRCSSATTPATTRPTSSASATSSSIARPAARGHPASEQPRLRRQPEGRLPLGDRAGPRHRRAAARRRPVRARAAPRDRRAAGARRGRRGVRLADDGPGRGAARRHAARTSTSATGSSPQFENARRRPRSLRVALGLPGLQRRGPRRRSRSSATPTASTSTPRSSSQLHEAGKRIVEIPIPTYYGDEICYVNGMSYARDVIADVLRYRGPQDGFRHRRDGVRHARRLRAQARRRQTVAPPDRAVVRAHSRRAGCSISVAPTAGSRELLRAVRARRDRRRRAQGTTASASASTASSRPTSTTGIPDEVGGGFDVVLAADVLEHVRDPERLLEQCRGLLQPRRDRGRRASRTSATGTPRARSPSVASTTTGAASSTSATCGSSPGGASNASRGAWDSRPGAGRRSGCRSRRCHAARRTETTRASSLGKVERVAVDVWPTMFGFQFLYELEPSGRTPEATE